MQSKQNSSFAPEQAAGILKEIAESGSFAEYCVAVDSRYQLEWFHQEIAEALDQGLHDLEKGKNVRLAIFMPPRNGKSDMGTQKFPSFVLGRHPEWPIMTSSYSADLATDFGLLTRSIMESEEYQTMFDTRLRKDAKAKGRWITEQGGGYTAIGVGGAATGRGFKIGIIDDPFKNREEADSPVIRESRYNWYRSTFYTRGEGATMIILILTRWHDDDLAGRILRDAEVAKAQGEEYDDWKILQYKAIATEDDERRSEGEALWPSKFPIEALKRIRTTIGPFEFSALYQQNPIDEENRKFKSDWYKYRKLNEVLEMDTYNVMTIDPRGKDDVKHGKDYIGITINFIDREGKWNVLTYRTKLSATDLIDLMFTNWKRYNLHKIGIEDNQFTQGLKTLWEQEMITRGIYMTVELLRHGGASKTLRIEALVPRYERGGIYHLTMDDGANLCVDLEDELSLFPKATNDDASDSLAYQTQVAQRPTDDDVGGFPSDADFDITSLWD